MLKVENLFKSLGDFHLRNITFEVAKGEYFVFLGASGVGKSILLETIAGMYSPNKGKVWIENKDITHERIQKRNVGIVFQNGALFPHLTVAENVSYGLRYRGMRSVEIENRVIELANELGFSQLLHRKPTTLSGGEAQRVALARALAVKPRCLLLDEPLSSIDKSARSEIRTLLRKLNRSGITVIHVTHDYEEALALADRVGVMERGTIVQIDTPEAVFKYPASEFVADFVGVRNFFRGRLVGRSDTHDVANFVSNGIEFSVLTDKKLSEGNIVIRSEEIALSKERVATNVRNNFQGKVVDAFPVKLGIEVIVDVGVELAALVTEKSQRTLDLKCGKDVFVSIEASAIRFVDSI